MFLRKYFQSDNFGMLLEYLLQQPLLCVRRKISNPKCSAPSCLGIRWSAIKSISGSASQNHLICLLNYIPCSWLCPFVSHCNGDAPFLEFLVINGQCGIRRSLSRNSRSGDFIQNRQWRRSWKCGAPCPQTQQKQTLSGNPYHPSEFE